MSFVTICGRLGRDADLRQGDEPSKSVANFSVAEDIGYGENKRAQWWKCALWGNRAEKISQYLTKGTPVTIFGNPELREYDKKDGTKGHELTVRVVDVVMQGRGSEAGDKPADRPAMEKTPQQKAREAAYPTATGLPNGSDFEDDRSLPF